MSGKHAAHGPTPHFLWLASPYDRHLHAFRQIREPAEAVCSHTAPATKLTNDDTAPRCHACLLIVGDEMASRLDERDRWA